jgi:beta-phosphoglucomutase
MKAALFDMDGVLVDSYAPHYESWLALAQEEGLPFDEAAFVRSFGRTSREVIRQTWPDRAADADALDARKEAHYRRIIEATFPAMDGAVELLRTLHGAGWRLAVASSGPPENIDLVLDRLGERSLFSAVVTGRDVERGKPDPQVFLTAAARLGVAPERCVVVEDAPLGVVAAHAGGMVAVALLSTGREAADFVDDPPELMVASLLELGPDRLAALLG